MQRGRCAHRIPDGERGAAELPEAVAAIDGVELGLALIQRGVGRAERELGAALRGHGELHRELGGAQGARGGGGLDERRAGERGERGVREAEDAVLGAAREGGREGVDGGEGLRGCGDAADGDGVCEDGPGDARAGAVADGEVPRLRAGGGGGGGVVFGFGAARRAGAVDGGDPEVCRAG